MQIKNIVAIVILITSNLVFAGGRPHYKVSITNITRGQIFTPQLVAVHARSVQLFELGQPASSSLEQLAESGNTEPLTMDLLDMPKKLGEVKTIPGLLGPGETATVEISGKQRYLSVAAMLIPTNDTFVAINRVPLPRRGSVSYTALGYDAGSEQNDQNCAHIPGPRCNGVALSPADPSDEGYVYVSNGFHDLGSVDSEGNEILGPAVYDWRNPIAIVTIKRLH